jgi:phospholipase A1
MWAILERHLRAVIAMAAVFMASVVPAQAAEADASLCVSIADDSERLRCFDAAFNESAVADEALPAYEQRLETEQQEQHEWFAITPHKPTYILPATYNFNSNYDAYGEFGDLFSDAELKFQLSLKTQLWPGMIGDSSLWFGYTQQSYWQLYADSEASAPFRETNYQPELFWSIPSEFEVFGLKARTFNIGLNHQSNGQSDPLSRSWNRITGEVIFEGDRTLYSVKTWVRIDDPENDNNPNIEDYMGRVELGWVYRGDRYIVDAWFKNNLESPNRSSLELNWAFPLAQHLRGYVQFFTGYGENMIDMENRNTRIGIGISLTDWL